MDPLQLMQNIIAAYERHGWKLRRVLLRPELGSSISEAVEMFRDAEFWEADFDALWFARPSHDRREAWELRLVAEQPYALFAAFEADDPEEDRESVRTEMENRMRESAKPAEA